MFTAEWVIYILPRSVEKNEQVQGAVHATPR